MMSQRVLRILGVAALATGCGDDTPPTAELVCGEGARGVLGSDAPIVVGKGGADLEGASLASGPKTTLPTGMLSIECADDIAPTGFLALGPAVRFGAEPGLSVGHPATWSDRPFELTLPYRAARLPDGASRRHIRIVAKRGDAEPFFPVLPNHAFDDQDPLRSRLGFRAGELTTYQVVVATDAGQPRDERFAWRAAVGISMGGSAAMSIALRNPDAFDAAANLGGEPGPSMRYTLSTLDRFVFGGFCTAADQAAGRGAVGALCPQPSRYPDQFEAASSFEHMLYQAGQGVGLTLSRSFYLKGVRDLARAFSNPALHNPDDPYAPPGVPSAFLALPRATRCGSPVVLTGFHDREYNPDGAHPVITFCDGGDSARLGVGVFDPQVPQTDPAEVVLAVDLNRNGVRDSGEPVIHNRHEPYLDVGVDGLSDLQEPGYDPATNPDPAGDNFHWQRNPKGSEGNLDFDRGEPFEDVGLDGVAGTCQAGSSSGCFDTGEGDGQWNPSPTVARWYEHDVATRVGALRQSHRDHLRLWFDAGIRDFLNNSVGANHVVGQLSGLLGLQVAMFDGFAPLGGARSENSVDVSSIQWAQIPRHVYVRYGNPDATPAEIAAGDGRHVGNGTQLLHRVQTAFAWLNAQWPNGDREDTGDSGRLIREQSFVSASTGRTNRYSVFVPPGYDAAASAATRYPVAFVFHGYGQGAEDIEGLSILLGSFMSAGQPLESRFQKFIMVFVDGRCQPGGGVPLDPTGDRCEGGTFYLNSPLAGGAQMEANVADLIAHIDATYRTRQASTVAIAK